MLYCFASSAGLALLPFYTAYFIVSLLEHSIQIATVFFRVDLLSFAVVIWKTSLEIICSRIQKEDF